MKYLGLTLKNFARVLTGLGKTQITLDLSQSKTRINLFAGPNGSAKTSIMSCIHPFAFNNSMDNRDNSELIIEDKDGEKTIILEHDGLIYTITHKYKRTSKDTLSVKSYIHDGENELNGPGNVGEFKNIIFDLFGLDETFMNLMTLGVNVKGYLDQSSTERKNFSVKLFEELGIYNTYYKHISNNAKIAKALMTNVSSKLVKYKDLDITELNKTLTQLESKEKRLYDEMKKLANDIGNIDATIDTKRDVISNYKAKELELSRLVDHVETLKKKRKYNSEIKTSIEAKLQELSINKSALQEEKNKLESTISITLEGISSNKDTIDSLQNNQSKLSTTTNYDDLLSLKTSLEIELDKLKEEVSTKTYPRGYNRDDLIRATIYLDEVMNLCGDLLLCDDDSAINVVDKYNKDNAIEDRANKLLTNLTNNMEQYHTIKNIDTVIDMKVDKDCTDPNCPYKRFYELYVETLKTNNSNELSYIEKTRGQVGALEETLTVINVIHKVNKFVNANPILTQLPNYIFNANECVQSYIQYREIYDKTALVALIDYVEKKDRVVDIEERVTSIQDKLAYYDNSKELLESIAHQLDMTTDILVKKEESLVKYRQDLETIVIELKEEELLYAEYSLELEIVDEILSTRVSIQAIKVEMLSMDELMKDINKLISIRQDIQQKDLAVNDSRRAVVNQLTDIRLTISDYENLKKDQVELEERYDILFAIRQALSPSKGIPTEYISGYIKNMAQFINELLDIVYNGSLRIFADGIVVDENEFTIPYMKNGTKIRDIVNASQGERSFISLAFSLAMIKMTDCPYNIMLLDEAETTLDVQGRSKFIPLLESYLDSIGAEQVFVISHNNAYDSHPITLILTAPDTTSASMVEQVIELY